ncbi:DeoR/GlpR family DNA-binding transcription regulator [Salinibacterium sp. NK8237]|uniref:DeoR/GlpR family DNA-binding transcription regulator n=1 Tax=Salinibacterium sp. NK8237 TaxID=2792038 RepID=UPI0018CD64D0|nr:DeoR/GlpR family DNA-binding transcription regulator [Salinibacterium sp. NK8237]MBH0130734.1 DeoR/GlpR transcriptional regulator [Salinibacterium sp. NK8237]
MTQRDDTAVAEPAAPRNERIVAMLQTRGFVSVRDLAAHLEVSEMTVRRDLRALAKQDMIRLVHGGAALTHGTLRTPDFVNRAGTEGSAKRAIAETARRYVRDGDTVAIDSGTTTFVLAERLHDASPRSIVTNSIPVVQLYLGRPQQSVVVLGGDVIPESQAMVGSLAVSGAEQLRATTFFLGAAAADARGLYVETDSERPTKRALMDSADTVILLCDASKFAMSSPIRLATYDDVDVIITDAEPPADVRRAAEASHTEIVIASS